MLETAPDRMTLQCMKKKPDEDYREYAIRWKNVASMVRPSLTSREENSMSVDTLPSPYYDMLIVNTFVEFGDLMYSVRRIEDGIKRGRIRDTGATTFGKKGNVPNKHVEEQNRRKFETMEEFVGNLFHSRTSCNQVPPIRCFSPQASGWKNSQGSDSGYYQSKKRKKSKVYHALPMSYGELLPILVQNYGISVIPARLRRPPYPKGYDINARCEYHGGVKGHSTENCMTFKDKVQSLINADPIKFRELVGGRQEH